jgi:hypothetical protein
LSDLSPNVAHREVQIKRKEKNGSGNANFDAGEEAEVHLGVGRRHLPCRLRVAVFRPGSFFAAKIHIRTNNVIIFVNV